MLDGHVDLRMELDLADAMGSCSTTDAEASVGAPDSGSTTANNRGASSSSFRGSCTGQAAQSSALSLACAPIVVKRQWGGRPALHRRRDGRPGGGRGVRRFGDIGRDCVAADVAADVVSEMMTNIFHKLLGQSAAHAIETHLDADCLSLSLVRPPRRHPRAASSRREHRSNTGPRRSRRSAPTAPLPPDHRRRPSPSATARDAERCASPPTAVCARVR